MECTDIFDIIGGVCGILFFAFIIYLAFKKDDDFHNGGMHP
jgi:glycopeptide antibiotics resistance protein